MATLSSLNNAKYALYDTLLSEGRRRRAELAENDLVRANAATIRWLLGVITGSQSEQTAALAELEDIYSSTITAPTSIIADTSTETNTRKGTGVLLTAGDNTVVFSSALDAATYSLTWNCYSASGGMVQWTQDPSTRTVNGFDIWVASACKIDYIAMEN